MSRCLYTSLLLLFCLTRAGFAQPPGDVLLHRGPFGQADTLRGTLDAARSCYDVQHYRLAIQLDLTQKRIAGDNTITFRLLQHTDSLRFDLFSGYTLRSVRLSDNALPYRRQGHAVFVALPDSCQPGHTYSLNIAYEGPPPIAQNPPWAGGLVWSQDSQGRPWASVACEGLGASSWWPCKDHLSDEPELGADLYFEVPRDLYCVSNGILQSIVHQPGGATHTFHWQVHAPINTYNLTFYLGHYVHRQQVYAGMRGPLVLDCYLLAGNAQQATPLLEQAQHMLQCFEDKVGPYPFYTDGYALVEAPYWGMEHQGAIAYGNSFRNNEWGWDYILIHESGHEWFGNYISVADHADLWVHESFTTYLESVFVECQAGYGQAQAYLMSQRGEIQNADAIQGPRGLNFDGWASSDPYYKGSWMLHSLRSAVNQDSLWWAYLRGLYHRFGLQQTSTEAVLDYTAGMLGQHHRPMLEHYLYYRALPHLVYALGDNQLYLRWQGVQPDFTMPVELRVGGTACRYEAVGTALQAHALPEGVDTGSVVELANNRFLFTHQRMEPDQLQLRTAPIPRHTRRPTKYERRRTPRP
jgi:aminopeptidase N